MKAFDKVPHKQLLQIIEYYSLPLKVTKWVKDFLSNGKQQVLINGVPSQWHTVLSDVPEGSVLGPILLVLCINTLIEVVDNSKLLLFADDNKLFNVIFKDNDSAVLQESIEAMFNWTRNSLPHFRPAKCFTMIVRSKSKPQCNHIYSMNNKPLEVKLELKVLRVLIDDNLRFSHHISEKVNKANQIMGLMRRSFTYMDQYNFILLFKSLVRLHL